MDSLMEAAPDALIGVDLSGRIALVNAACEALFGYERDELLGAPLETLVPEAARAAHHQQTAAFFTNPHTRAMGSVPNLSGRRQDGTSFPADIALSRVDTADGPLVIAAVRDMTHYLRVQEQRARAAHLAALVDDSTDAIFDITLEGVITSWNPAAATMYGYAGAEIIGKPLTMLTPAGRPGENRAIQAMLRAGQAIENFETGRIRKDGSTFHACLSIKPVRDEAGAVTGARTNARDLTKEEVAFEAAARMAAIVADSADAIIGWALDGAITSWNPAAAAMYGYDSAEMMGKSVTLLTPAGQQPHSGEAPVELAAGGDVVRLESVRARKDGTTFPASLTISPIRDARGVLIGASSVARDVSDARAAQQEIEAQRLAALERLAQLDKANAGLRAVNQAMAGFINVAGHNLRTPLASVLGYSDLLLEHWPSLDEDTRRAFASTINRQSHNLSVLVHDLLTLSTIEGGMSVPRPTAVSLAGALSGYLQEHEVPDDQVPVTCPDDLVVRVDPTHLARIVDNIVQNAFKYGQPPIHIEARRTVDAIEVRVVDHGLGVPPEFVPRLFDKFSRADSQVTAAHKGTGLGLSIARGLARVNGGDALYEPIAGGGSCFIVRLPWADSDSGSASPVA